MQHPKNCVCNLSCAEKTKHFLPFLRQLRRVKKEERIHLLESSNICFIQYLADCCEAFLRQIIKVPAQVYKKLKHHRNDLLFLANKKKSLRQKKHLIVKQKGGFILQYLVPALISGLVNLGGSLISKLTNGSGSV